MVFSEDFRQALGSREVLQDNWKTTANVIRQTGREVDKEIWLWHEEVQEYVQRKRLAKKKYDTEMTKDS